MSRWITAQTSVIGFSHTKSNTPCQDSHVVKTSPDGEWLIIVVSDGAGTASKAEVGSKHVSNFFAQELLELVIELKQRTPGNWINDFVISKVLQTRIALRNLANSDTIKDYNCTLVACLIGPSGGFSIHIGDGSIIGGSLSENSGIRFLSEPENGEYANETYFITEGDWVKHLRVMPIPKLDWVICCTDGGGDIALVSDKEPKLGFLLPVVTEVFEETETEKRNEKLRTFLENPKAYQVTSDDMTLVLAVKQEFKTSFSDAFKFQDHFPNTASTNFSGSSYQNSKKIQKDKTDQVEFAVVKKSKLNFYFILKLLGPLLLLFATFVISFQVEFSRKWIAANFYNAYEYLNIDNKKTNEEVERNKLLDKPSERPIHLEPEDKQVEEKLSDNIDQKNTAAK